MAELGFAIHNTNKHLERQALLDCNCYAAVHSCLELLGFNM